MSLKMLGQGDVCFKKIKMRAGSRRVLLDKEDPRS